MTENLDKQIEEFQIKTELKQLRFDLKTQRQMNKFLTEKIKELKSNPAPKTSTAVAQHRLEKLCFGQTFSFTGTNQEFDKSFNELKQIINRQVSQNKQKNSSK